MAIESGGYPVKPLKEVPRFLGELERLCANSPLPEALAQYLKSLKITLTVNGDTSSWDQPGKNALFMGDHRDGLEYFFLSAVLGEMGRSDLKVIGKAYAVGARLSKNLDPDHEYILPVLTGIFAKDKGNIFSKDLPHRMANRKELITREEIKRVNSDALHNATNFLAEGYAVTIFPSGGVNNGLRHKWYPGVGRIIQELPEEARENTMIVPFQFEPFSQRKIVQAAWLRSHHIPTRKKEIICNIGEQITVAEFLRTETNGSTEPKLITEKLRGRYRKDFGHSSLRATGSPRSRG